LNPLQQLVSGAMRIQDELAGFSRALDITDERDETTEEAHSPDLLPVFRGNIRFEHVGYRYPDDGRQILSDVDFELSPGETTAIVGSRGAGKTTTINLLSRFFAPTEGRILLDGVDIQTLSLERYRGLVGLVDQDALLFDVSVRDNIAFGARDLSDAEIRIAAEKANASGFIELLPRGFDTVVGERGVRLSGGQRQCIALARALVRKPRILILDEGTSHLDAESEASILASVQSLGDECTRLIVGHRLSTIRAADRVVMLEGGRIVLQGTHDSLLAENGRYAEFLSRQLDRNHPEADPPA
jgi:ABC-type multidrug transport system fused ATPase/permease subunit